jgi:protein phosphatase 1 regulatory subunit 37
VRDSTLRNISLRYNRVSAAGAVALALMIKDYPDTIPSSNVRSPSLGMSPPPTPRDSPSRESSPRPPHSPLPKAGPILPPPRHPPKPATPTTYTPYVPRSKRNATGLMPSTNNTIPIITSNSQGGITTARHPPTPLTPGFMSSTSVNHHGPSVALLDKVRALDALPRLGALRTLDLKGNDIRVSTSR